jgi:hypothetical protein
MVISFIIRSPLSLLWLFDPTSMEDMIWDDGIGNLPVQCWKPVVCCHTQI